MEPIGQSSLWTPAGRDYPCPQDAGAKIVSYFRGKIAADVLPSFSEAAILLGADAVLLDKWRREDPVFADACAECRAALSDYLIRQGLTKRFDASLVKYLLALLGNGEEGGEDEPSALRVTLRVLGGEGNEVSSL